MPVLSNSEDNLNLELESSKSDQQETRLET